MDDAKDGLKCAKKAVEIDPNSWYAHDDLGAIYANMTRKEYDPLHAEQEYHRAMTLNNENSTVHFDLVVLYVGLKRFKEASEEMQDFLRLCGPTVANDSVVKMYQAHIAQNLRTE